MADKRPDQKDNALVQMAKYSEIGFIIPAAVIVGYLIGLGLDRWLHTHWIYLVGLILGAIAGFVSMIRRVLKATREEEQEETGKRNDR